MITFVINVIILVRLKSKASGGVLLILKARVFPLSIVETKVYCSFCFWDPSAVFFSFKNPFFSSSARIGTLLEQLQKLCLAVTESKNEQEKDYDQLRYITNKLQQMLSTQGENQIS